MIVRMEGSYGVACGQCGGYVLVCTVRELTDRARLSWRRQLRERGWMCPSSTELDCCPRCVKFSLN